jgi:hypothetical protein
MRQVFWIVLLTGLCADVQNAASVSRITLYADAASTACTLADDEPRLADVFVVHEIGTDNSYLVNFRLTASAGFTGAWVEDALPAGMFAIGTSPDGITIDYRACRTGDASILRVTYQLFGTSSPCSFLQVSAPPGVDFIEAWDCSFWRDDLPGGKLLMNPNETCPCEEPVPVQETTWGGVKALYR